MFAVHSTCRESYNANTGRQATPARLQDGCSSRHRNQVGQTEEARMIDSAMENLAESTGSSGYLFVWRGRMTVYREQASRLPFDLEPVANQCPLCGFAISRAMIPRVAQSDEAAGLYQCGRCGFWVQECDDLEIDNADPIGWLNGTYWWDIATLKQLDINDSALGLSELGTYLKCNIADVEVLSPRRFEELVADVFRNLGFAPRLTKQTRDGGYDIHLLETASGKQVLVECKRYSRERRVRVSAVRELLGVQLREGVPSGKIVATTTFTSPAAEEAAHVSAGGSGYSMELIDIVELTKALNVYNEKLPPREIAERLKIAHR